MRKEKLLILTFLLLINNIAKSQTQYVITYQSIIDNGAEVRSTDLLYIDDKSAYFEVGKKEFKEKDKVVRNQDNSITFHTNQKEKTTTFILIDFKKNHLFNTIEYENIYRTIESIPQMNWELQNEFKEIDNTILQKATLIFRGRTYEAWCNLEIPISIGPWKFNNAPGLIYEITSDEEGSFYTWILKEFKETKNEKVLDEKFLLTTKNSQLYTPLKENIQKIDNEYLLDENIISSRLPDGMFIDSIDSEARNIKEIRSKRLEKKYEWEE